MRPSFTKQLFEIVLLNEYPKQIPPYELFDKLLFVKVQFKPARLMPERVLFDTLLFVRVLLKEVVRMPP